VARLGPFTLVSDGSQLPVFAFSVRPEEQFTVYDLSEALRRYGWQVPAYNMPDGMEDVHVLRVVVRNGFTRELATLFLQHLRHSLDRINGHESAPVAAFRH
jgi:glutamate decarboxylase